MFSRESSPGVHWCLYNKVIYPVDNACKVFKLDNQDQMYGKPIFIVYQPKTWEGRGGDRHLDKNWPVSLSRVSFSGRFVLNS